MNKQDKLNIIKLHWGEYSSLGGFKEPATDDYIPELRGDGVKHWALVLRHGRSFLSEYPSSRKELEEVIPKKLVRMLVGE